MTTAQIELLMARDVDDVSETAVQHPAQDLSATLVNAAALLSRDERNVTEHRLFLFKLLRFVQAALAGARDRVPDDATHQILDAVQLVLKRNEAPDVNRAARDVLSLLTARTSPRKIVKAVIVSPPGTMEHLKSPFVRGVRSAKTPVTRTKSASKPKGLPR